VFEWWRFPVSRASAAAEALEAGQSPEKEQKEHGRVSQQDDPLKSDVPRRKQNLRENEAVLRATGSAWSLAQYGETRRLCQAGSEGVERWLVPTQTVSW
jgi:hypothetical protein